MVDRHNHLLRANTMGPSNLPLYYASLPSSNASQLSVYEHAKRTKAILIALNSVTVFDGVSLSVEAFTDQVTFLFNTVAMDEELYVRLLIVNRLVGRAAKVFDRGAIVTTVDAFVNTLLHAFKYTSNVRTANQ
jgi:hypothetical protein